MFNIFFEKKKIVDFYECKNYLISLLELLGVDFEKTEWKRIDKPIEPWCRQYQSAQIYFDKKLIGVAGKVDPVFLSKLDVLPESDAFFFELDADFLLGFVPGIQKMQHSHENVVKMANKASKKLALWIKEVVKDL